MWVHGTTAHVERDTSVIYKRIFGDGAVFRGEGTEWFHFAVPTPVYFGGVESTVSKVFVLWKTNHTAKFVALHVYDGPNKIQEFNNLNLSGDYSNQAVPGYSEWAIEPVHIRWGLGLSVQVAWPDPNLDDIIFTSAGADFFIP
jgi:hypothetical protein